MYLNKKIVIAVEWVMDFVDNIIDMLPQFLHGLILALVIKGEKFVNFH